MVALLARYKRSTAHSIPSAARRHCQHPQPQWQYEQSRSSFAPGPPTACGWQTRAVAAAHPAPPLAPRRAARARAPARHPARCLCPDPSPAPGHAAPGCPAAAPGCRCLLQSQAQGAAPLGRRGAARQAWADPGCVAAPPEWLPPPPPPLPCLGTPAADRAGALAPAAVGDVSHGLVSCGLGSAHTQPVTPPPAQADKPTGAARR